MPRRGKRSRKHPDHRVRSGSGLRQNRLKGFESLQERIVLSATPFGAQPTDTAEFLLGTVNVNVVLMESNDVLSSDNPTVGTALEENWTPASIASVKQKVTDGLEWWVDTLAEITDKHQLSFNIDFTHADSPVSTRFEPITQPSTDYQFWIYDFLNSQVDTTGSFTTDVKTFNHQQREAKNTNWAFTIFVVNDENDANHRFAPGGLDRAFAFPGGLFLVTLASRPASTITHETGHIFWALDEYQFGGTYSAARGYYNTQNENAWNNPTPGYERVPSILDRGSCEEGGGLLCDAFTQHTSSPSSLEMIGWRDSDGDGIFDVLDVAHTLEGSGSYDPITGTYRFVGESAVQTLPNLNPRDSALPTESLQNDITINRISRAEYRIDGGAWQTAANPDSYVASLDIRFAVPSTANQIEIRTIDATTGVTSPVFSADLTSPEVFATSGIAGFVFGDTDGDGQFDTEENGFAARTVRLVDSGGQPVELQTRIEPDDHAPNSSITNAQAGIALTAIGSAAAGTDVYSRGISQGTTGSRVFGACSFVNSNDACSIYQTEWTGRTRQLRIDFSSPVSNVSIDALSNNAADFGRLSIYDSNDNLLSRYTTESLSSGQSETMRLSRAEADIAYAIAGGHSDTGIRLDNLRIGPASVAMTDQAGAFVIPSLAAGTYQVQVETTAGQQATTQTTQTVTVSANQAATANFGFTAFVSPWQNPNNRFDVNNDGSIAPIDALLVINDVNEKGARALTETDSRPPFIDVDGGGNVAPIDVLHVINAIEAVFASGESAEGELTAGPVALPVIPVAEGEFVSGTVPTSGPAKSKISTSSEGKASIALVPPTFADEVAKLSRDQSRAPASTDTDDLHLDTAIDEFVQEIAAIWVDSLRNV